MFLLLISLLFNTANAQININGGGYRGWTTVVPTASDLPIAGNIDGDTRVALDTDAIYVYNFSSNSWLLVASPAAENAVTALTGDVHATGPGAVISTIQPNVVTNAKLAQAPTLTMKGNGMGGTANEQDLTVSQVFTLLGLGTAATQNSTAFDAAGAATAAQAYAIQRANQTGTQLSSTISDFASAVLSTIGSYISSITYTAPIVNNGTTSNPIIACTQATGSVAGCLAAADFTTFAAKQVALSSTTPVAHQFLTAFTAPNTFTQAALASGDIPNNAANTSGNAGTATAFASTPSQCSSGMFATGITASGAANCATPSGSGTFSPQHLYVSNNGGSDSNSCNLLAPCLTISHAISVATAIPAAFSAPVIISVDPANGTPYSENLAPTQQGITVQCQSNFNTKPACQLYGHVTINLSGTAGGANYSALAPNNSFVLNGFSIAPQDGSVALQFSGSAPQYAYINNNYISTVASAPTSGSAATVSNSGTNSTLILYNSDLIASDTGNPAVALSAGRFWDFGNANTNIQNSGSGGAVNQTGSSTSFIGNALVITGTFSNTGTSAGATITASAIGAVTENASGSTVTLANNFITSGSATALTVTSGTMSVGNNIITSSATNTAVVGASGILAKSSVNPCTGTSHTSNSGTVVTFTNL